MINRREFMILSSMGLLSASASKICGASEIAGKSSERTKDLKTYVSVVKTSNRKKGIAEAINILDINPVKGKNLLIKPNLNTVDPFPGSTHNETLETLILKLKDMGAEKISVGERSGPPDTSDVIKTKGIDKLCQKLGLDLINFEKLPIDRWVRVRPKKSHWKDGFDVAAPVLDSECIVSTCCLKTHGYGGVFTISLKLAVGITHKRNMSELHSSSRDMRKMIAEINQAYKPSLIIMDAIEAFVDGGPMRGIKKRADAIVAGTDRIAVDAVGLAILKELGSNSSIMNTKVFEQEQIKRAVEIGLGVNNADQIRFLAVDEESRRYSDKIREILTEG